MTDMVGRDGQIATIGALLGRAAEGRGGALVLRGEAGIGKSALLGRAIAIGRGLGARVLSVTGVQAEGQIAYAGLEHLLRPLRHAGRKGASPYRMAVEVLNLLSGRGEPVLLAIEDAHWLDAASWETLTFLCRRVESDSIAVLLAVRDGVDVDRRLAVAGLPELRLEPLSDADAARLLDRTAPGLATAMRGRVLAEAAGNPLGVVELGAAVARSGGSALPPSTLPLSARVERTFGDLVADLPAPTRELLLIAALNDGAGLAETLAAATVHTGAEVREDAIEPAVAARLVSVDDQYELRFRHPLLRSALRQRAAPGQRRRVHEALAAVLTADPQRRVWHRAAATPGRDEALAEELTGIALGAAQRQAVTVAIATVGRAVQLSADPAARGRRQILASTLAREQGDSELAQRMLADLDTHALLPADRARLSLMRESFSSKAWSGPEQLLHYAELIDGIRREGDPEHAVESLAEVALRVYYSHAPAAVSGRFAEVALSLRRAGDDPRLAALLLTIDPVAYGAGERERLRELAYRTDLPPAWRIDLSIGAWAIGDFTAAAAFALASAAELRAQGRIGSLAIALTRQAAGHAGLGDARSTLPLTAECIALAEETGQPMWAAGGGLLAALAEALSGDVTAARRRADLAERAFTAARRLPMLSLVQRTRGVAALAEGHADDAFRQLRRIFDPADSAYLPHQRLHCLGFLAEAAALGGFLDELGPIVSEL